MKTMKRWLSLLASLAVLASMIAVGDVALSEDLASSPAEAAVPEEAAFDLIENGAGTGEAGLGDPSLSPEAQEDATPVAATEFVPEQSFDVGAAAADGEVPKVQDRSLTLTGNQAVDMNVGDTLRLYVGIKGVQAVKWTATKKKLVDIAFNAQTGECAVTALDSGTVKLKGTLNGKKNKKIVVTLTINDSNHPTALSFGAASPLYMRAGGRQDLLSLVTTVPAGIDCSRLKWKSSKAGVAKVVASNGSVVLNAVKAGNAKITVSDPKGSRAKAVLDVVVEDNRLEKLTAKPVARDVMGISGSAGWTLWPLSVAVTKNNVACQFYLLNNTGKKVTQIRNMKLTLAAQTRGNIIASGDFSTLKVSVNKNGSKLIKLKLTPTAAMAGVFLPEHYHNGTLYFDINRSEVTLCTAGGEAYPFFPTRFPTTPSTMVESVTMDRAEATIALGDALRLSAAVSPDAASDKRLVWSSSNESVATVRSGLVTALSTGTTTITALAADGSGQSATCAVTVVPSLIPVTQVTLKPDAAKLAIGESLRISAAILPSDATNKALVWTTDNAAVATVRDGLVKALSAGTATITATAADGRGQYATCKVTVANAAQPTAGISLNKTEATLEPGDKLVLAAQLDAQSGSSRELTWTTSNAAVATVSNGIVTARDAGTATITVALADDESIRASCVVTVTGSSLSVSRTDVTLAKAASETVTITYYGSDSLSCASSDESVATADLSEAWVGSTLGLNITGVSEGTAAITIANSLNTESVVVDVTVSGDAVKVTRVSLDRTGASLSVGGTLTLYATAKPDNASVKTVTWKSSNEKVARMISSSFDGTVNSGIFTAQSEGVATITATADDGSGKSASCIVTVKAESSTMSVSANQVTVQISHTQKVTITVTSEIAGAKLSCKTSDSSVAGTQFATAWKNQSIDLYIVGVAEGTAEITIGNDQNDETLTIAVTVTPNTTASTYRALLVGNDRFVWSDGTVEDKVWNGNACKAVQNTLNGVKTPSGSQYSVTYKHNLTKDGLINAINSTFSGAKEDDVSLFYFASHGDSSSTDSYAGALVMSSGDTGMAVSESMKASELASLLSKVPGKVIVLLDTCGSGAAIYANGAAEERLAAARKECDAFDRAVISAFADADPGIVEPAMSEDGVVANTGELIVANKFYVLTSSKYLEMSWGTDTSSYFTDWFTQGIGSSGSMPADTQYSGNKNGVVDFYELYKYVQGVGDNYPFTSEGKTYYQHVQAYPSNVRYPMFQ